MKYLKFTLRDLFWLVVVTAMGLGWWSIVDLVNYERRQRLSDANAALTVEISEMNRAAREAGYRLEPRQDNRTFELVKHDQPAITNQDEPPPAK